MCQAKPGNRCSPHAKEKLTRAVQRANNILQNEQVTEPSELSPKARVLFDKAHKNSIQAAKEYDATVEGIKNLKSRIRASRRAGNKDMTEKLENRLAASQSLRERRKNAYKDTESFKTTSKYRASLNHETDEEEMKRRITEGIGDIPTTSEEYSIREREVINNLHDTYTDQLKRSQSYAQDIRELISNKVDDNTFTPHSPEAGLFKDVYEDIYRTQNRIDSLNQMLHKLDSGFNRDGSIR